MNHETSIWQSILSYSKTQRIGIILLFSIVVLCQSIYFFMDFKTYQAPDKEASGWLEKQQLIDRLKEEKAQYKSVIYPFNPNYITDFKGYRLGMSVAEINRLLAYRKQNKFVNSAEEFQAVTQVSDSLLRAISPYFKFPDWVNNKNKQPANYVKSKQSNVEKIIILNINEATKEDLMKIYGIGDKISDRILEQRTKFGAFVSMEQMKDIWGLSPEVITNLNSHFEVKSTIGIKKVNINYASVKELSQFAFFRYALAKEIVIYRSMHGDIAIEDLSKIKGFPVDKIKIIALYLEF